MEGKVLSVTELNLAVQRHLNDAGELQDVYVRGEISNYKAHPNQYSYFDLKDQGGVVKCNMKTSATRFILRDGMKVVLHGRLTTYVKGGIYQLYAQEVTPEGVGELTVAYEQLKARLYQEGLFSKDHKKPLPQYPNRIALITAASGDAVHDVIQVLHKRYPLAKVLVMSVRVQGDRASREIAGAIRYANRWKVADVVITGRGGGSIEDLWAFNTEEVARAIYDSELPVISAVGHEPDVTISDYVADARALTPTNAGMIVVPDQAQLLLWLRSTKVWLEQTELGLLNTQRQRLTALTEKRVLRDHLAYVQDRRLELLHLQQRLGDRAEGQLARKRNAFAALAAKLDALSPLKVFARGYAMVRNREGQILKTWQDAPPGTKVAVTLGEGGFTAVVEQSYEREA